MEKLSKNQVITLMSVVTLDYAQDDARGYLENLYTSHVGGIDVLEQESLDQVVGEVSDDLLIFVTGDGRKISNDDMIWLIKTCRIPMYRVACIGIDDEMWWIFNI